MTMFRSWIAHSLMMALFVLVSILTTTLETQAVFACEGSCTILDTELGRSGWTGWSTDWNAVAADGDGFWLAFDGGVLRWTPEDGIVERVTAVEGLPHFIVHDIVMDGEGGFWISGDAGISHRGADRSWTHHTVGWKPSPDNENMLAGAAGTVWIEDSDGQVHRWTADAGWVTYTDAHKAVEADFSAALTKQGPSDMWFVSFGKAWVGYEAYDGTQWHSRNPPDNPLLAVSAESESEQAWSRQPADTAYERVTMRQDSDGNLYAPTSVHPSKWDGDNWQPMDEVSYYGYVEGFFVDLSGSIWQAYFSPMTSGTSYFQMANLMGDGGTSRFHPFQINDVISTEDSLWFFSPGIIRRVSSDIAVGTVEYHFSENRYVSALRSTADEAVLFSPGWSEAPFQFTRWLTTLEDRGTPQFGDDIWNQIAEIDLLEDWEVSPDGSIWYLSSKVNGPAYNQSIVPPTQIIGDTAIQYPAAWPIESQRDLSVFTVADEHRVLIAFDTGIIVRLHNNGTLSDFSDDQWDRFDLPAGMRAKDLAQDSSGRIWTISADDALYQHTPSGWMLKLQVSGESVLVPAAGGLLFVVGNNDAITLIHDGGQIESVDITDLATENLGLMRTTSKANSRWAVGVDGTVWFSREIESEASELVRRSEDGWQPHPLPSIFVGSKLTVDQYDQVWLLRDDTLWRFSPLPDYEVSLSPSVIVAEPGTTVQGTLTIRASEGFSESVALETVAGDLDLSLDSTTASVNQPIPFSLLVPDSAGDYPGYVTGRSGLFERTGGLQVIVMENIYSAYLPMIH